MPDSPDAQDPARPEARAAGPPDPDVAVHDSPGSDLTIDLTRDPEVVAAGARTGAPPSPGTLPAGGEGGWKVRWALPPRGRQRWSELDRRWTSLGEEIERPPPEPRPPMPPLDPQWREEWLPRAIVSGFGATAAMTLVLLPAYFVALSVGSDGPGATTVQRWLWGLAHNTLTEGTRTSFPGALGVHLAVGMAWALVYAAFMEPRLRGPAWRRGMLFSLAPWALSLLVFFPAVGGGVLGMDLGAGPLPVLGNLVIHLVYGAVLGAVYSPSSDRFQTETGQATSPEEIRIQRRTERSMAFEMVVGLGLGAGLGWLGSAVLSGEPVFMAVFGAIAGALVGAIIGSFRGMNV